MRYTMLGRSGTAVSTLALGTMTFGTETDEAGAFCQLDRYAEAGGNLVDTADVYSGGASEAIIGRWLADRPDDLTDRIVLATKGRFPTGGDVNDVGLSRRHLDRALTASLRRLGADSVDLYQTHAWDPLTPVEETLAFMDDAVRAGKIRYWGLSNVTGWQLQKIVSTAEAAGLTRPVTLQPQYNLLARELEWEIAPAAAYNGLGLLPWSPPAGGLLTGKYRRDTEAPEGTRAGSGDPFAAGVHRARTAQERTWAVVDAVTEIATKRDISPARIALAWVAGRPGVTSVILGARTLAQLDDNLAAAGLVLDADETERLEAAGEPETADYPYGPLGAGQRSRVPEGGFPLLDDAS
ncbi:aldo/keto reductase [Streptomyces sp. GbtcB7]|uniref:aldo/keto reductase n=1 Tax=Streptomyces sp. GbtcB7 TaxID=2824752 RepID=UPI001C302E19|nr:aldo/keto reductase [Streptomyces sp. GbtcB7]